MAIRKHNDKLIINDKIFKIKDCVNFYLNNHYIEYEYEYSSVHVLLAKKWWRPWNHSVKLTSFTKFEAARKYVDNLNAFLD